MKGIKMSGRTARKQEYSGYPDGIPEDRISSTADYKKAPPGKVEVVNINNSNGYGDLDKRLIQLTKDLYTKVDEAKAKIQEHIVKHHRDDDIYKFLTHTTRGWLLCRLFGYRTVEQRRRRFVAKKQKVKSKLNKLEV